MPTIGRPPNPVDEICVDRRASDLAVQLGEPILCFKMAPLGGSAPCGFRRGAVELLVGHVALRELTRSVRALRKYYDLEKKNDHRLTYRPMSPKYSPT